jgi:hypothetical protein
MLERLLAAAIEHFTDHPADQHHAARATGGHESAAHDALYERPGEMTCGLRWQ